MRNRSSPSTQFWLLCALTAIAMLAKGMLEPLVPLLAHALGSDAATVGTLVASAYLLPLFVALPLGNLVDAWGPRGLITAGAAGLALAPLLVAAFPTVAVLFVAQALVGLAQLAVVVASQALVGGRAGGRSPVRGGHEGGFGWFTTFASAGQFAGPLLAGWVADATSYRFGFLVAAGGGLLVALASRALSARGAPARSRRASQAVVRPQDLASVSSRGLGVAVLLSVAVLFSIGAFVALLPVYLKQLGHSATMIGFLLSLRPLTALALRPQLARVVRRFGGRTRAMAVIAVTVAAGLALVAFGSSVALFALASVAIGVGSALSQPLSMAMTVEEVQGERVGLALGLRLTANRGAQFLSPIAFGLVAQALGFGAAFGASAAVAAVLGFGVVVLHRRAP